MKQLYAAQSAAMARQLRVSGEEILVDGKPLKALVGSEDGTPELGPDGEPRPNVSITITLPADDTSRQILTHGVPIHIRGRDYALESFRRPSPSYMEVTCYRR
jgi:hypothetical protein